MKISIIVATSPEGAIGKDNKLLWHLPADLKFFKEKTMGHHLLMGRKTYESIGKPLPGRTTIVITRDRQYQAQGCIIAHSLEEALTIAKHNGETEAMITGGAELYKQALMLANTIYLTIVNGTFEADTYFFYPNESWTVVSKQEYAADEKNKYAYSFITLQKTS